MSGRIPRMLCALIVAVAVLLTSASALADSIEVKLNTTTKVYQKASSSARSVKVPKGLRVKLQACAEGWGKITYKRYTAYVKLKYLDRVDPLKAYVTENTSIFKDASGSARLSKVSQGTVVYVVGADGSYVRVQNAAGTQTGYIKPGKLSSSRVNGYSTASSASGADNVPEALRATLAGAEKSRIERAIFVAQALIGTPYASRANPPKTFDCATYARYCFKKADGITLKDSSRSQGYDDTYDKVDYDHLKRGDLVCFDTVSDDDLSDHVGIYLGSGYFLHASSAAKKVMLSSLSSGYYKRTFSWGRRIISE